MILLYLIRKEFLQMLRNRILPIVFILLPFGLMNMIPRLATQEVKNLTFTIVDNDHSSSSMRLTNKLSSSSFFTLVSSPNSYNEAMDDIQSGESDLIVVIEKDFEKKLTLGETPSVQVSANGVNGIKAGLGTSYMAQIITDFASDGASISPIRTQALFNPSLDYKAYMVPAVIALLIVLLVGFLPALNIVGEKEKGTIEQINVTPVGRMTFILSKQIPYWAIGLFLVSASMCVAYALYGIFPKGSLLAILLLCSVFILVMSSIGLIVSNYSDTLRQAALLMFFFLVICILMSGLLTPIASMPTWAQWITSINPFRYVISALRILYLRPSAISEISSDLLPLSCFAVIFATWAVYSYRKSV